VKCKVNEVCKIVKNTGRTGFVSGQGQGQGQGQAQGQGQGFSFVCHHVRTGSENHPDPYPMGTGGSFAGDKAAGT
jgi:hypothetical protein